jgi:GGDEF domain-containing protein
VYMGLARGYAQLQLLYRFVGTAGRTAELDEVVPTVLSEAAELLHATRAQMVTLVPGSAGARVSTWEDGLLREDTMDPDLASRAWWAPARSGEVVLQTHAPEIRQHPPVLEVRDGIAVPLREDDEVVAVLTVCDRTFEEASFNREDVRVFETLAAHTAVALDKARVVDRLRRLVTEREHDALHDALTGLPNRRAFHEAVEAAMSRHESGAVLLLGVDDFRDVNDTLGHSAGDGLLSVTGERLRTLAPGMVARLGGDEFAILLPGADTGAAVETARSPGRSPCWASSWPPPRAWGSPRSAVRPAPPRSCSATPTSRWWRRRGRAPAWRSTAPRTASPLPADWCWPRTCPAPWPGASWTCSSSPRHAPAAATWRASRHS